MAKKAKDEGKNTVKISCRGAGALSIALLSPLQGDLKSLSDENYRKLRREIEVDGFIEPISIWEDEGSGKVFVLNGHQRLETLRRMKEDGWSVPEVPVNYVEAKDLKGAKRMILAMASQFGVVNPQSVVDFAQEIGVSAQEVHEQFTFADFDMDKFLKEFQTEPATVIGSNEAVHVAAHERTKSGKGKQGKGGGGSELNPEDFQQFAHQCPRCKFEFD